MLTREQLEQMGGRATVVVPVPSLDGQEVTLHTPSAFDRDRLALLFAQQFDDLGVEEADDARVDLKHVNAMRLVFGEAVALTLLDEEGKQLYADSEAVRRALRSEVLDDLGSAAWDLFHLGQDHQDEALGNSEGSTASGSPSE